MSYTAEQDPLCYPGTTVLNNKLNLRTQPELDEFELAMSLTRADEEWPAGRWPRSSQTSCRPKAY